MDDLLQEFLAEVGASAAAFDGIALERSPMDPARLRELTALFHTIRGTCRFLELPRLGALASAAESFLESVPKRAEPPAVAPALEALKRVLSLLAALEETGREPQGNDASLLAALARGGASAPEPEVAPALPVATATADRLDGGSVGPPADREMPVETGALADEIASLVLARNRLAHLVNRSYRPDIASALERLSQATDALRNTVGQLRLTRFEACWPSLV
ncbi:MAG: Hpt domain-containing protein, partial [Alphaproteobacteria bacterium]